MRQPSVPMRTLAATVSTKPTISLPFSLPPPFAVWACFKRRRVRTGMCCVVLRMKDTLAIPPLSDGNTHNQNGRDTSLVDPRYEKPPSTMPAVSSTFSCRRLQHCVLCHRHCAFGVPCTIKVTTTEPSRRALVHKLRLTALVLSFGLYPMKSSRGDGRVLESPGGHGSRLPQSDMPQLSGHLLVRRPSSPHRNK